MNKIIIYCSAKGAHMALQYRTYVIHASKQSTYIDTISTFNQNVILCKCYKVGMYKEYITLI